jgi:hypothetical protein
MELTGSWWTCQPVDVIGEMGRAPPFDRGQALMINKENFPSLMIERA